MLAERLAKQNELDKLEQIKIQEKNEIQSKLDALDPIYFAFNSSKLTAPSKDILSKLVYILKEYPKLSIEVNAHTDSRGPSVYNQKLSESRLQSTIDYLYENGIESSRIVGEAFGEERLVNECDDHTKCSEVKHKQNRRSEYKVVEF